MSYVVDVISLASDWFGYWIASALPNPVIENSDDQETVEVHWIGGPLDGLTRAIAPAEVWQLPPIVEMSASFAQPAELRLMRTNERFRRLAIYVLDFDGPRWFYRFDSHVA